MNNITPKSFNLVPTSFEEAMQLAEIVCRSGFCPREMSGKPGDVLIAMQYGAEIGLAPMQALQNIAVINGRPTLWGDAAIAVVRAHPDFEFIKETFTNKENENGQQITTGACCTIKRKNEEEVIRTFTIEDAQRAGLWGKQGPWRSYPKRMLQMRARSFALRDCFPDALKGLSIREEVEDYDIKEVNKVKVKSQKAQINRLIENEVLETTEPQGESPDV